MGLKIGDIFEFVNGDKMVVTEGNGLTVHDCDNCYFLEACRMDSLPIMKCGKKHRSDGKHVYFKRIHEEQ